MSIGGPIIKDKMHFFLTYESKEFTTPNTVQAPQLFGPGQSVHDWVGSLTPELRENYGPVSNPFDEELLFAKLDWDLGSPIASVVGQIPRGTATVRGRRRVAESAASPTSTTTIAGAPLGAFRRPLLQRSDRHLQDTQTRRRSRATYRAAVRAFGTEGREFSPVSTRSWIDGVDPRNYFFTTQSGMASRKTITFTDLEWLGQHTVKPLKFKDVELGSATPRRRRSTPSTPSRHAGYRGRGDPFQVTSAAQADTDLDVTSTSKNRHTGLYLQTTGR